MSGGIIKRSEWYARPKTQTANTKQQTPNTNMNIEGMTVENNPTLKRGSVDWARIAYWAIKLVSITAMLTALVLLLYGTWLFVAWLIMAVLDGVAWGIANFATVKRGFYTVVFAALFFYAVRAVRAVARFYEAKARSEDRRSEDRELKMDDGGES